MNTLRTLHDAFGALEDRADSAVPAHLDTALTAGLPAPYHRSRTRAVAPVATIAAVLAVVVGVALWLPERVGHDRAPLHPGSGGPSSAPHRPPSSTPRSAPGRAVRHAKLSTASTPSRPANEPSAAELTAKAQALLQGIATIHIDPVQTSDCGPSSPADRCVGDTAIGGTLTGGGHTGGFLLSVGTNPPGFTATCDGGDDCIVNQHRPDGSSVAVSAWHDPSVAGGIDDRAVFARRDGSYIELHVSNEQSPKGRSKLIGTRVLLTAKQLVSLVSSYRW